MLSINEINDVQKLNEFIMLEGWMVEDIKASTLVLFMYFRPLLGQMPFLLSADDKLESYLILREASPSDELRPDQVLDDEA